MEHFNNLIMEQNNMSMSSSPVPVGSPSHLPAVITTAVITALLVGGVMYFLTKPASAPTPSPTLSPGLDDNSSVTDDSLLLDDIVASWQSIQAKFTIKAGESGVWSKPSLVQILASKRAFVFFDDGLSMGACLIKAESASSFSTVKCYNNNQIPVSANEWSSLITAYGPAGTLFESTYGENYFEQKNGIAGSYVQKTSMDTTSWKTYTNTKYGFELKYPNTSKVVDQSYGPAGTYTVEILYDKNSNGFEPIRLVLSNTKDNRSFLKLYDTNTFSVATTDSNGENYIHFSKNNNDIYANCLNYARDQKVLDFCNQILSTFRFTR